MALLLTGCASAEPQRALPPKAATPALSGAPAAAPLAARSAEPDRAPSGAPSAAELKQLSTELAGSFRQQLLPFWYPRTVSERGGFAQNVSADGKVADDGSRFLVFQSRMTWLAAEVARRYPELAAEYTKYTRHGLNFLQQKLWDAQQGGFHFELDGSGKPLAEKHAYGIVFGIYASAAGARTTLDPKDRAFALQAFEWFDAHAHDAKNGGYFEPLTRAGKPRLTAPKAGDKDAIGSAYGTKSMNTHIHALEALTELYRLAPSPALRTRLEELFLIVRDKLTAPDGHFHMFLSPDFQPVTQDAKDSYGHNIEGAFLLLEAAEVLGTPNDPSTQAVARKLALHALESGWDPQHHGLYNEGEAGGKASDLRKVWWVQAESLNGLLAVYEADPANGARFFQAFREQWSFVKAHVIDPQQGEWRGYLEADGSPAAQGQELASKWKAGYHSGRALMFSAGKLAKLSSHP